MSVGGFFQTYMSAPSDAVRKSLIEELVLEINSKPIEDIFDMYEYETDEDEMAFVTYLKNREFLKREDREYIDHMLKYTKVANSKWGQILLHPEKIPNPASVLQWDVRKLLVKSLKLPYLRRKIIRTLNKNDVLKSELEKIEGSLGKKDKQNGEKFRLLVKSLQLDFVEDDEDLSTTFQNASVDSDVTGRAKCIDQLDATYGYPLEVILQSLKWIILQMLRTFFETDGICRTDGDQPGARVLSMLCSVFGISDADCDGVTYIAVCTALKVVVSGITLEPLRLQPTVIQTIASKENS